MPREGRDELELYLDSSPATKAAREIKATFDDVSKSIGLTALKHDLSYSNAFRNIQKNSAETARKVYEDSRRTIPSPSLPAAGGGSLPGGTGGFAAGFRGGAAALVLQEVLGGLQNIGDAYLEGDKAARSLDSTARRYNESLVETQARVAKLRAEHALSRTEAERALALATAATAQAGRAGQGGDALGAVLNILGASGGDRSSAAQELQKIIDGQTAAFQKLLGQDPAYYYDQWARSVGRTVESLTDAEKAQVGLNAVLVEGQRAREDNERYLKSAAGQWETLTKSIDDARRATGEYLLEINPSRRGSSLNLFEFLFGQRFAYAENAPSLPDPQKAENDRILALREGYEQENLRRQQAFAQRMRDARARFLYEAKAAAAREEGPYADIRRATAAEQDRLRRLYTDKEGVLSPLGSSLIGVAGRIGKEDEAKRTLDISKQLEAQLAEIQSRYNGDRNPLVQMVRDGKREIDLLRESLDKFGAGFSSTADKIMAEARKLQTQNFFKGLANNINAVSDIDARLASLQPNYERFAMQGRYGQWTDDFHIRETYSTETEAQKAQRIFRTAADIAREVRERPGGTIEIAGQLERETLLNGLGGLSLAAIGADPNVRDRYVRALEEERRARIDDRIQADKIRGEEAQERAIQNDVNLKLKGFFDLLTKGTLTPQKLVTALENLGNMSVAVDLNVKSDRPFQAAVPDGTSLDRVKTG